MFYKKRATTDRHGTVLSTANTMIATLQPAAIRIDKRKIRSLINDNVKSAEAINLIYVNDKQKGISRVRKGEKFVYTHGNSTVKDPSVLGRIRSLVIPPAWEEVWICASPAGHIQVTGLDINGRKQYRYHPLWNALRSETKFFHLYDFGIALPEIRKQVNADLALKGLPLQKVLAAIISVMEYTGIRIGNHVYEKLYGSFGLTTLKDQHVNIKGSELKFKFIGKKGVAQNITLKSKKLAKIVTQCRDIPGKELFQYYDENGIRRSVDSGMVNDYLKSICEKKFSAKDFRTWVGTVCALESFMEVGCCDNVAESKKKIIEVLDIVAKRLGNTRLVCRKYYVHPAVIEHYTNNTLSKYFEQLPKYKPGLLSPNEQMLLEMLGEMGSAVIAQK